MSSHPLELIFVMQGNVKILEKKGVNLEQCSKQSSVRHKQKIQVGRDCGVNWTSLCSKQGSFQIQMRFLRATSG